MYSAFVVGFGVLLLVCQDIQAQDVLCNRGDNYVDVVLNAGDEFTYDTKNNRKNKYKKNQNCLASYELGESCSGASISCPTFALRGNRRCTSGDIMEIFGDSTDQSFCRDSGPMDYQPDGDFFILFTSNQRGSAEGFKCTVKCIDGGSGPTTQSTAAPTGNTGSTPTASTTASTATSPTTPTTVTTPTTPTTVTTPTTTTTEGSSDCKCGLANRQRRIVGGEITEANEYPWQVGLVDNGGNFIWCGGALIGDQWILTAAHCTAGSRAGDIQVLLGEHDVNDNSQAIRMSLASINDHPKYNDREVYNDYSLLKLKSKVDFSANEHVRPVCLPANSNNNYAGSDATVTGWGTTQEGGSTSSKLREVTVQVMTNTACSNKYAGYGIKDRNICAQVAGGGKDACQGDSGGPLVYTNGDGVTPGQNYEHIGVVSWGIGCAQEAYPGVYARTTSVLDWITSTTSSSWSTCSRQ